MRYAPVPSSLRDAEGYAWATAVMAPPSIRLVTAAYTVLATDETILGDATTGAFNVTLPPAAQVAGRVFTVKRVNAGDAVTVDGDGSETIDGAATYALSARYKAIAVQSDGTSWHIIAQV